MRLSFVLPVFLISLNVIAQNVNFTQSHLPVIIINTNGHEIPDDPKITAHMAVIDNGEGAVNKITDAPNNYNGSIAIEIRGQSTQMFPQKCYGFETRDSEGNNNNVALLGFPKENDWILYAPYTDKSMMRNTLTFKMYELMGRYSSRTRYCELVINDDYQGVYVLMEHIKVDKNRVNITKMTNTDNAGDALTGGYIFKVDKTDDYIEGYHGFKSFPATKYPDAKDNIFQFVHPKPSLITNAQKNYLETYIETFESNLASNNFSNPQTGYPLYINVNSFVDNLIVNEISNEVDKYRYSTYFYKDRDSKNPKMTAGPIWDFNLGYGNVNYHPPSLSTEGWAYESVEPHAWSKMFWWKRLMEDDDFKQKVYCRWTRLRDSKLNDAFFNSFIDGVVEHLGTATDRHYKRWPILGEYVWPNYFIGQTFSEEVEFFRNWLFDRVYWIDNNIEGAGPCPVSINDKTLALEQSVKISAYNKTISVTGNLIAENGGMLNVFSISGQLLLQKNLNKSFQSSMELNQAPGIYIIKVLSRNTVHTAKVLLK